MEFSYAMEAEEERKKNIFQRILDWFRNLLKTIKERIEKFKGTHKTIFGALWDKIFKRNQKAEECAKKGDIEGAVEEQKGATQDVQKANEEIRSVNASSGGSTSSSRGGGGSSSSSSSSTGTSASGGSSVPSGGSSSSSGNSTIITASSSSSSGTSTASSSPKKEDKDDDDLGPTHINASMSTSDRKVKIREEANKKGYNLVFRENGSCDIQPKPGFKTKSNSEPESHFVAAAGSEEATLDNIQRKVQSIGDLQIPLNRVDGEMTAADRTQRCQALAQQASVKGWNLIGWSSGNHNWRIEPLSGYVTSDGKTPAKVTISGVDDNRKHLDDVRKKIEGLPSLTYKQQTEQPKATETPSTKEDTTKPAFDTSSEKNASSSTSGQTFEECKAKITQVKNDAVSKINALKDTAKGMDTTISGPNDYEKIRTNLSRISREAHTLSTSVQDAIEKMVSESPRLIRGSINPDIISHSNQAVRSINGSVTILDNITSAKDEDARNKQDDFNQKETAKDDANNKKIQKIKELGNSHNRAYTKFMSSNDEMERVLRDVEKQQSSSGQVDSKSLEKLRNLYNTANTCHQEMQHISDQLSAFSPDFSGELQATMYVEHNADAKRVEETFLKARKILDRANEINTAPTVTEDDAYSSGKAKEVIDEINQINQKARALRSQIMSGSVNPMVASGQLGEMRRQLDLAKAKSMNVVWKNNNAENLIRDTNNVISEAHTFLDKSPSGSKVAPQSQNAQKSEPAAKPVENKQAPPANDGFNKDNYNETSRIVELESIVVDTKRITSMMQSDISDIQMKYQNDPEGLSDAMIKYLKGQKCQNYQRQAEQIERKTKQYKDLVNNPRISEDAKNLLNADESENSQEQMKELIAYFENMKAAASRVNKNMAQNSSIGNALAVLEAGKMAYDTLVAAGPTMDDDSFKNNCTALSAYIKTLKDLKNVILTDDERTEVNRITSSVDMQRVTHFLKAQSRRSNQPSDQRNASNDDWKKVNRKLFRIADGIGMLCENNNVYYLIDEMDPNSGNYNPNTERSYLNTLRQNWNALKRECSKYSDPRITSTLDEIRERLTLTIDDTFDWYKDNRPDISQKISKLAEDAKAIVMESASYIPDISFLNQMQIAM